MFSLCHKSDFMIMNIELIYSVAHLKVNTPTFLFKFDNQ